LVHVGGIRRIPDNIQLLEGEKSSALNLVSGTCIIADEGKCIALIFCFFFIKKKEKEHPSATSPDIKYRNLN
jgi:hypothetical protein